MAPGNLLKLMPVWIAVGWVLATGSCRADAAEEGMALAAELRGSLPPEKVKVNGLIRIRDAEGRRSTLPFEYRVEWVPQGWTSVYETSGGGQVNPQKLTVLHRPEQPNEYYLETKPAGGGDAVATTLRGSAAAVPFAGSDFWLTDLGMDYLHWPHHQMVEDLKIKMRKGRPCQVLDSLPADGQTRGYSRVRSWIDRETGKPIIAEAYDQKGQVLKEFEVGGVTKVNGVWELKNLEMRNVQSDSRTLLEFRYEQQE